MRKLILYIVLLVTVSATAFAEQWRLHPTYDGSVERLVDTPDYTYILSRAQPYLAGYGDFGIKYLTLFRYDKEGDELLALNKENLLSENILQTIEYNPAKRYLVAVYDNGNIDLIYDNGDIVNVPGLKLAGSDYSKAVGRVSFAPEYNEIYIPTGFGYIVIDDSKGEVKRTVNLGVNLTAVARFADKIVAGNNDGLYSCDYKNYPKWEEFVKYFDYDKVKALIPFEDRLYMIYGDSWSLRIPYLMVENGALKDFIQIGGVITSVEPHKIGILISGYEGVWYFDKNHNSTGYTRRPEDIGKNVVGWSDDEFWIDNGREGLSRAKVSHDENWRSVWTTTAGNIRPNASAAFKVTYMAHSPAYGMLVRNAGNDARNNTYDVHVPDLISGYKDGEWTQLGVPYRTQSETFYHTNPKGVALDPLNGNHVYAGSVFQGLLRLDLEDPSRSLRMGRAGGSDGTPGYVTVFPDYNSWREMSHFSVPAFDSNNVMWTSWIDRDKLVAKQDNLEFWYWTPENRLASKDAASFRPFGKIKVKGVNGSPLQTLLPLRHSSNKNMLLFFSSGYENPLVMYHTNGTLDNTADDVQGVYTTFSDRDGGAALSPESIICAYEDPDNGDVWVGYDLGVFRLVPSDFLKNGAVYRIRVSRDDGTGQADYLLSGVRVNNITSDPSGRKWFSTGGGGVVVTNSNGTEVLKSYTTSNSSLPDNTVYGICYNPDNNSMMISTEKGLAELFLSIAASGSTKSDVLVYPNPVRPDYFGYVQIEGVADKALVKIVDAGGNLIKELGFAAGGEAKWDVTNLNARRVPAGVYYILASGGPDSDSFSAVGKVLVVN